MNRPPIPKDHTSVEANAASIQVTRGTLVVALQREFEEAWVARLQSDLLARVQATGLRRVIFDATAVETMDSVDFQGLRQTFDMLALMGAVAVIVGIRPGIVSALVTMGADISGLSGAPSLDRGLEMLDALIGESDSKARTLGRSQPDG